MDLPLGMYPFTFDYLQVLETEERREYLQQLETLWLRFQENHLEKHPKEEETEEEWKKRLHRQFLSQIIEFYNNRFYLPQSPEMPLFPNFLTEEADTSEEESPSASLDTLIEVAGTKEFSSPEVRIYTRNKLLIPTKDRSDDEDVSPPHKRRKLTSTDEKRLSRYRSTPSKALSERLRCTLAGRFLLVEEVVPEGARVVEDCLVERNYRVWDRTGKIYDVKISNLPACNCPASSKGLNCVHILFIFAKLLQIPEDEPILFQRALLTTEIIHIYSRTPFFDANTCTFCFDKICEEDHVFECKCSRMFHAECQEEIRKLDNKDKARQVLCKHCRIPKLY